MIIITPLLAVAAALGHTVLVAAVPQPLQMREGLLRRNNLHKRQYGDSGSDVIYYSTGINPTGVYPTGVYSTGVFPPYPTGKPPGPPYPLPTGIHSGRAGTSPTGLPPQPGNGIGNVTSGVGGSNGTDSNNYNIPNAGNPYNNPTQTFDGPNPFCTQGGGSNCPSPSSTDSGTNVVNESVDETTGEID